MTAACTRKRNESQHPVLPATFFWFIIHSKEKTLNPGSAGPETQYLRSYAILYRQFTKLITIIIIIGLIWIEIRSTRIYLLQHARTRPESTRFGVFSTKPISFVHGPQRYSAMKGETLHLSTQYKTQGAREDVDSHSVQATATAYAWLHVY